MLRAVKQVRFASSRAVPTSSHSFVLCWQALPKVFNFSYRDGCLPRFGSTLACVIESGRFEFVGEQDVEEGKHAELPSFNQVMVDINYKLKVIDADGHDVTIGSSSAC